MHSGPFVTAAKTKFSNSQNPYIQKWRHYVKGDPKRQEYLKEALDWISSSKGLSIDAYMSSHRYDSNISELEEYFNSVIDWVSGLFDMTDHMAGLKWGKLYEEYHTSPINRDVLNARVKELLTDEYVQKTANIYEYVLGGEKHPELLDIRFFDKPTKTIAYNRQTEEAKQRGISNCPFCALSANNNRTRIYKMTEMEADHVTAWSKGGSTSIDNCQMLCKIHNRAKGNK